MQELLEYEEITLGPRMSGLETVVRESYNTQMLRTVTQINQQNL